ncbi:MAG: peptidoglycan DD-metalloendopeptidase family protein [Xanthomonadales bacterium]|uniref:M23 family metallopeptidase n=1 Tax=Hydrogenophaga sp. TaxID=1904254 RepID=UPI0016B80E95|nr:M23 family metallopeptidase [Hydrogenophaga sp.]NIM70557.1 peptidoglycan DD-metalloendopeptidase family protein [Xanthomonadales bacterium]NIN32879.1 peptidoglycan DD-metalloendopeptidase family protein [Hydrogenophaga sp.]NIN59932.1 peptidoglycan DD-metalloendopeptidase family protein [Xanthomonadales bacterium]NIN75306.1 peptidoglycan DD-metalloendopeptidase family protein [Xanthomonadales bacterium]NIO12512.1 peptidoglycan DD-metalloendopeptidase family protein [Xanthomonadales bacterium
MRCLWFLLAVLIAPTSAALELSGEPVQGGLMFGRTEPGARVWLDDTEVLVSADGHFVIGFGRDENGSRELRVAAPDGTPARRTLDVAPRDWAIERVDGLPPRTVTPEPEAAERIRAEATLIANARGTRALQAHYANGFRWPAHGRISGVYGSQRILNGEPRRPHFGLDVAAPTGTAVHAPADGVITLAHPDMYYSGGTIILDHGQGLSSTFLHLSAILVEPGTTVRQGDLIGRIGATGRASGPHLDWRMNWLDRRVDPQRLVGAMPGDAARETYFSE